MEKRYMISDAAKLVQVESHVLRYWEEELEIEIPRNEMGHRYYTEEIINIFKEIKELKDQGYLLKAIKRVLPEIIAGEKPSLLDKNIVKEEKNELQIHNEAEIKSELTAEEKMQEFERILGNIVSKAMIDSSEDFTNAVSESVTVSVSKNVSESVSKNVTDNVSKNVSDSVSKQMDYLFRMNEEKEEQRYKKLDELIRGVQKDSKKSAGVLKAKRIFGFIR